MCKKFDALVDAFEQLFDFIKIKQIKPTDPFKGSVQVQCTDGEP